MKPLVRISQSKKTIEKKILSQHHKGLPSNIIAKENGINITKVSKVLKSNGIKPRAYRTNPDCIKNVLRVLILSGFTYKDISSKTHVARSYIREYVSQTDEIKQRSEELFRRKNNQSVPPSVPSRSTCSSEMIAEFQEAYRNGKCGFCLLVTNLQANEEQIAYLFSTIDEEMLKQHNENLKVVILAKIKSGIPAMGTGKKVGVSPSYVANIAKK